jgi:branched-chain amino acid transport system permease protein
MLLEAKNVVMHFGGVRALDGVSLGVAAGAIHGLIGPNGAGKTTLINILSGLVRPTCGEVLFLGEPIQSRPAHYIAALGMARTFQNIRLFPSMTCLENVIAGQHLVASRRLLPRLLWLPSAVRSEHRYREQAMSCLERVGIANRAGFLAKNLSYGERRRLEIARALASAPRMLLLDEPVAGMRQRGLRQIGDLVRSLAADGMTILLIEHNMGFVMDVCARITVMNFGRTITTGTPAAVGEHPEVIEAYLGDQQSRARSG